MNACATRSMTAWNPRVPQLVKQRKVFRKRQVDQDLQERLARALCQGESVIHLLKELLELGPWIELRVLGNFYKVSDPTMDDQVRPAGGCTMTGDIGHSDLGLNEDWNRREKRDPYCNMPTPKISYTASLRRVREAVLILIT